MSSKYLHKEIREINGAYGSGASLSDASGIFSFYSYRDPFPLKSLETFQKSIEWIKSTNGNGPTDQDILEAKLAVFKSIDAPIDVDAFGMAEFIHGINHEERDERRRKLLAITLEDIKELANRVWPNGGSGPKTCSVIIGGGISSLPKDWQIIKGPNFFQS